MNILLLLNFNIDNTFKFWKLILDFISTIAWPSLVLIIVLLFEKQLRTLIRNTKKLNVAGNSIEIENPQQNTTVATTLDSEANDFQLNNILEEYLGQYTESSKEIVKSSILRESNSTYENTDNYNRLLTFTTLLYFEKHFQNVYNYIYGSQIEILYKLDTNNNETKDSLKYIYDNAVANKPDFYKDYSYGQYLQFLEKYALIFIAENNNITLTDQGADFLTFMERLGLSKEKLIY